MKIITADQRSPEWFAARLGVPSASQFSCVITPTGKKSTQIDAYLNKMVAAILTGQSEAPEQTDAMQRGIELEAEARGYYELIGGQVEEVGFFIHDDGFGCSPDGLVGADGLLEIKCPLAHTHVEYLRENNLPAKYIPQVQGQLLVTGRQWCDFLSYHPDMKPLLVRVERDEKFITTLHDALKELVANIKETVETIKNEYA
jgi:putative phage-type endonuclease